MITLDRLELAFGPQVIFGGFTAQIGPHDRIGLVGSNGQGKSTLLRVLMGEQQLDGGGIRKAGYVTLGHLAQEQVVNPTRTVYEEAESAFATVIELRSRLAEATARMQTLDADSDEYRELVELTGAWEHQMEVHDAHLMKPKVEKVLLGLGFSMADLDRPARDFSGGWQMRIALARLLLRQPSLLLLDEPTNHLDLPSLRWVESYLKQYEGAYLIVSHDRAFLDTLTERTFSLSRGRLEVYEGNFSFYLEESEARRDQVEAAYKSQQRQLAKTQAFIDRFRYKATKAAQVQSRIKALAKVDRIEIEEEENEIGFRFPPPPRPSRSLIKLVGVGQSYGPKRVFSGLDLELEAGDRVAVVGLNGAGKSTLLKIVAGQLAIDAGTRTVAQNTVIGYFAQHQAAALDTTVEVLDCVREVTPMEQRMRVRTLLGAFLFRGDAVFKKVGVLSGGEKSRIALARMLLTPSNLLLLDEPTNHLDMRSKAVLQNALVEWPGSFLIVSHDRDFLDPLCNKVLEVAPGAVRLLPMTVPEYIAKLEEEETLGDARGWNDRRTTNPAAPTAPEGLTAKERRKQIAQKRAELAPLRKQVAALETKIAEMEKKIATREQAMLDPAFFQRGKATADEMRELDNWKAALDETMTQWTEASAELEAAQAGG